MLVIGSPVIASGHTMIQYIVPDGCVHVYGPEGVPTDAIVREDAVPLVDGSFVFPSWLDSIEEKAAIGNP